MSTVFDQMSHERLLNTVRYHQHIKTEADVAELAQAVESAQSKELVEVLVECACKAFTEKAKGWTPGRIRGEPEDGSEPWMTIQDRTAQALLNLLLSWLPTDPGTERKELQVWVEEQVLNAFSYGWLSQAGIIPAREIIPNLRILQHLISYSQVVVAEGVPTMHPAKGAFEVLQQRWKDFLYNHLLGFSAEIFLNPCDKMIVQGGEALPLPQVAAVTRPILDQICVWLLTTSEDRDKRQRKKILLIVGSYGLEQTLAYIHTLFWEMVGLTADRYRIRPDLADHFLANPLQCVLELGIQHMNAHLVLCYLGISSRINAGDPDDWQNTVLRVDPGFWLEHAATPAVNAKVQKLAE
jgi:hypothetical protein